jgi:hypothetical protein
MAPAGETWNCPHCGQRILRSAVNCPACQRRLRFDTVTPAQAAASAIYPLRVEGTIHHPHSEPAWEYSVLVQVRDAQGAIIARHVVGVGAIQPGDARTFALQVEMRGPEESARAAAAARSSATQRKKQEPSSSGPPQEIHASGSHPSERLPGRTE